MFQSRLKTTAALVVRFTTQGLPLFSNSMNEGAIGGRKGQRHPPILR